MKLEIIKEIARQSGLALGKMNKSESIRAIQMAEGNSPCYNKGKAAECGQLSCLWRDDCQ